MGNLKLTSANEGISKQGLSVRNSSGIHQSRQMVLLFGASISTCRRREEKNRTGDRKGGDQKTA